MDNETSIKIYGLLGNPIKHSLSPLMHNAAFHALGLNAKYELFEKEPHEVEGFLQSLEIKNICGINVTVPYKEKVIPFLSSLSEEAQLIGAVNTIKVCSNKLEGYNTDGEGFIKHLTADLRFDPRNRSVAMLGAGGASKAIAVYLSIYKIKSLSIFDIDKYKLNALVEHLAKHFKAVQFKACSSVEELNIKNCQLLINATPIGVKENDPCLVSENLIHPELLVYDLIYNPAQTKLLALARKRRAGASNGLGMLLHQGAAAFKIWTGREAPLAAMRQALMPRS